MPEIRDFLQLLEEHTSTTPSHAVRSRLSSCLAKLELLPFTGKTSVEHANWLAADMKPISQTLVIQALSTYQSPILQAHNEKGAWSGKIQILRIEDFRTEHHDTRLAGFLCNRPVTKPVDWASIEVKWRGALYQMLPTLNPLVGSLLKGVVTRSLFLLLLHAFWAYRLNEEQTVHATLDILEATWMKRYGFLGFDDHHHAVIALR